MTGGLEPVYSNVICLSLENPPSISFQVREASQIGSTLVYHDLKGLLENSTYPGIKPSPWSTLPHYLRA